MVKIYALYKGEECLGIGTLEELAKHFQVNLKTIKFYLTPTYKKRLKKGKNRRELVCIGSD